MKTNRVILENNYMKLINGRHGIFHVNENDFYLGRSIVEYGEYSEYELKFIFCFINDKSVVVEVGSNTGLLSVPIAKRCKNLITIEPNHINYLSLCCNLSLNNLHNVRSFNIGISKEQCVMNYNDYDYSSKYNSGE